MAASISPNGLDIDINQLKQALLNVIVAPTGPNRCVDASTGNNALVAALVDSNGLAVPLVAGLTVVVGPLTHTLQAGANTFALNGTSKNIKSCRDGTTNIATAYSGAGAIHLFYDGTSWLDLSQ